MVLEEKNDSSNKNGNNEYERGPLLTGNFELKGRGSHDYLEDEEGDSPLLGFAETKEGKNNCLCSKLNGPALRNIHFEARLLYFPK